MRTIPIAVYQQGDPIRLAALPPLSLYIHFPWCVRKCPYCDFNSHAVRDDIPERAYLQALIRDLEATLPDVWGRRVVSVFIGGGTPSLMSPEILDELLAGVRARLALAPEAEVTLEANPGTLDTGRIAEFRAAGVNRLSLGVQSFDDAMLSAIGRIHDARAARHAIEVAMAHFDRVNIDLIYALPGQSVAQAVGDIAAGLSGGVSHISAYHLTLEPNTAFYRDPPALPDADTAADMQDAIEECLELAGFRHYEIAAFARDGQRCRHNVNYWEFGDYLGIGAGAHSKISSPGAIVREARCRGPREYMTAAGSPQCIQSRRSLAAAELAFEFMMNAMRLVDGWPRELFARRTGRPWSAVEGRLQALAEIGLVELGEQSVRPTRHGRNFLNELLQHFLD